jgi:glycosyltransferase involved in cell wall biosynthesis
MKIGIISSFLWGKSGKARYTRNLIHMLHQQGYDVYSIGSGDCDISPSRKILMQQTKGSFHKHLSNLLKVNRINKMKLDIVHCPGEIVPPYFWLIRAKKIITFGGDEIFEKNMNWKFKYELLTPNILLSIFCIFFLKNIIYKFIVVSEMMVPNISNALKIQKKRIHVIPHGVNTDIFKPVEKIHTQNVLNKLKIKKPYILHVSSFRAVKNTLRIVEAFIKLVKKKDCKDLNLVFVGEKKYQFKEVEKYVAENLMENKVRFLGSIDNELPILYSEALALCQPSIRETYGFPIIESLLCGTPVITSPKVGAISNYPLNFGLHTVNPKNTDDICSSIINVINDFEMKNRLRSNRCIIQANYSWSGSIKKHISLYNKLI